MQIAINFLGAIVNLWLEMSPYLLLGMVAAGILHLFLGKEVVKRQLGRGGVGSIVKATLLGVPLPVCSCGVIPLAESLRRDGAHRSSVLAFLVSTPTTGIDSILATYALLGPVFAIFRPIAAMVAGISLGLCDYFLAEKKQNTFIDTANVCAHCGKSHAPRADKLREFLHYSFVEVPADLARWLIIGVTIGAAITVAIPQDIFAHYLTFPWDFLAALAVGIPLYVCATGSIPIAAALLIKGLSPGAALVFLIAGPATNTVTLTFVWAKLGKVSFYLYLGNIIAVAVICGLVLNWLWPWLGTKNIVFTPGGNMLAGWVKIASGIALLALTLYSFKKPRARCQGLTP